MSTVRVASLTVPLRTDYDAIANELTEHLLGLHPDPSQWRYDAQAATPGIWLSSRTVVVLEGRSTRHLWQPHGWALQGFPWDRVAQLVRKQLKARQLLV